MRAGPSHDMLRALAVVLITVSIGLVMLTGCRSQDGNAKPGAEYQTEVGEGLYTSHCAHCHDVQGGTGAKLSKRVVSNYVNASKLYEYTRRTMPYNLDYRLSDEEYWAVTAYLLHQLDFIEKQDELGPDNAANVSLK